MYAVSQTLAHRGPGATRARARWQPYASPSPSVVSSRSISTIPSNYLNTPASSVSTSPPSTHALPICEFERPKNILSHSTPQTSRDVQKTRYAASLVDQAVKSLCEIWHSQDIPVIFLTSARVPFSPSSPNDIPVSTNTQQLLNHDTRNIQLPSPVSPTINSSSFSPSVPSQRKSTVTEQYTQTLPADNSVKTNLVPLRSFVHEVLRRSRTSSSVLQTALCYLEAIRPKVPELVRKEKAGEGVKGEPDLGGRIVSPSVEDVDFQQEYSMSLDSIINSSQCATPDTASLNGDADSDLMDTVRIQDGCASQQQSQATSGLVLQAMSQVYPSAIDVDDANVQGSMKKPKGPSPPLPPLPPLPSPLLCPRRAFLASLILASKFMQDRCYSNRAWAKLSGLPPREIGRCERALGEALDWRLWVGKIPSKAALTDGNRERGRPVTRCRSDSELLSVKSKSVSVEDSLSESSVTLDLSSMDCSSVSGSVPATEHYRPSNLRRSSTVPVFGSGEHAEDVSEFALTSLGSLPTAAGSLCALQSSSQCTSFWSSSGSAGSACQSTGNLSIMDTSPPTPTLSFSPASSSSSSDGERTIQMGSFSDGDVPTPLLQFPLLGGGFASVADFALAERTKLAPLPDHISQSMAYASNFAQMAHDAAGGPSNAFAYGDLDYLGVGGTVYN